MSRQAAALRAAALLVGLAAALVAVALVLGAGGDPDPQTIRPIELSGSAASSARPPGAGAKPTLGAPIFAPRDDDDDEDPFDDLRESREDDPDDAGEDDD